MPDSAPAGPGPSASAQCWPVRRARRPEPFTTCGLGGHTGPHARVTAPLWKKGPHAETAQPPPLGGRPGGGRDPRARGRRLT